MALDARFALSRHHAFDHHHYQQQYQQEQQQQQRQQVEYYASPVTRSREFATPAAATATATAGAFSVGTCPASSAGIPIRRLRSVVGSPHYVAPEVACNCKCVRKNILFYCVPFVLFICSQCLVLLSFLNFYFCLSKLFSSWWL
jgi:hypothetical protein